MAKEQTRGINVLVGYDSGPQKTDTLTAWLAKAASYGFGVFLQFNATTAQAASNPIVLGYTLPDEPNGAGAMSPEQCFDEYVSIKAVTNKPVLSTLDGGHILQFPDKAKLYARCADILVADFYPVNYNWNMNGAASINVIGQCVDALCQYSPQVWAALECCDMKIREQAWCKGTPLATGMRGPNGIEMGLEMDAAIGAGADGVLWFEDSPGNGPDFSYDGCTDEQSGAIEALNSSWIFGR